MRKYLPIIIIVCILIVTIIVFALIFLREADSEIAENIINTPNHTVEEVITSSPTIILDSETTNKSPLNTQADVTLEPFVFDEKNPDYREAMRQWVITVREVAEKYSESFLLIPQNCAPLFTKTGESNSETSQNFISAIDGIGVEGISYGNDKYNKPRQESSKDELIGQLDVGITNGLKVLAVDYCSSEEKIKDALMLDETNGYLAYIALSLELTDIPENPLYINKKDILTLEDAENWLYLLNLEKYDSKEQFVQALSKTNYDVIVLDAFFDTDEMLNIKDLTQLKVKASGEKRLIIAYLSIGEAEDYRYYWKQEYDKDSPTWMLKENSLWKGNYPVRYWKKEWQEIIATGKNSYLKRIIEAGFDGAYLDIVDGYETFEDME